MTKDTPQPLTGRKPEILAPAGDTPSFLAALAAGADAVYLGLKHFSARMEAENFGTTELARLTDLAHGKGARVYVAMNTLVKQTECDACYRLIRRLTRTVRCDGLIIQDLAVLDLARQAGFEGGLFLSTLANLTHPESLAAAKDLGASRVILPRELSIDEIRAMGEICPEGLDLEIFVHGALCYCVSGRCYWSSYQGGKSGLRGRCVQPCRRMYTQGPGILHIADKSNGGKRPSARGNDHSARFFSCQDLSLDVLAKTLLGIPHLASWKIEGRKKGPHYVYHVVTAYRMLRDAPNDAHVRKDATEILEMALGRPGTHARFLPQKNRVPTDPSGLTSSGMLIGKIRSDEAGTPQIRPRIDLLPKDYLRIGVEDERWHATLPVTRAVHKSSNFTLRLSRHKTPPNGTPVFLIDRREPQLLQILREWQQRLDALPAPPAQPVSGTPQLPSPRRAKRMPDMRVLASVPMGRENRTGSSTRLALWLTRRTAEISRPIARKAAWWLPPVVWPDEEAALRRIVAGLWKDGCRNFVCNAPWQRRLFPEELPGESHLIAGPFCNITNSAALGILARMGFGAAFASPELPAEEALALPKASPLPLGFVLDGFWPCGISRFGLLGIKPNLPFASPRGELFWSRQYGENVWIYPGWPLDLTAKQEDLLRAGYAFFAHMRENPPKELPAARRPGLFNWDGALL